MQPAQESYSTPDITSLKSGEFIFESSKDTLSTVEDATGNKVFKIYAASGLVNGRQFFYQNNDEMVNVANRVKEYNPKLVLKGVIVTKFKADKISNHYLDVIKTNSRTAYIETVVHEATKIKQATALHANIYEYDPTGRAAQEYMEVAEELLSRVLG